MRLFYLLICKGSDPFYPLGGGDGQQGVTPSQLDHTRGQLPDGKHAGAALIAQRADLEAIQIVDLLAQQRERRVGAGTESMLRQRLENFRFQQEVPDTFTGENDSELAL